MKLSLPVKPAEVKPLRAGLYMLVAPTKGGKTLFSLAFAKEFSFDFLYVNEPRSETNSAFVDFYNTIGLLDRDSILKGISSRVDSSTKPLGLVIDSIGDLFMDTTKSQGLGKGLTFDQQIFFKRLQKVCFAHKTCLVGTVNSRLIPAADAFEGTSEGFMTLINKKILYTDRDLRTSCTLELSYQSLNWACEKLGYGPYRKSDDQTSLSEGTFANSNNLMI